MDEDAYRFQKLRDEENKNYKERKDDYLNYSKDKEEIDAAHEKNLKRISGEETDYKKKKLEEEKQTLNNYLKENSKTSILIITHHQQILNYIHPDYIHIMLDGNIVKTGDFDLSTEIEKNGYKNYKKSAISLSKEK